MSIPTSGCEAQRSSIPIRGVRLTPYILRGRTVLLRRAILDFLSCHNGITHTGWLKQQKLVLSQFRSLEVQDQSASMVGFWWCLFSWLVDNHLLAVSSHALSSVCTGRKREVGGEKHRFVAPPIYAFTG